MNLLDAIKRKLSQTIGGAVQAVKNIFQPKLVSPLPPASRQPTYTPPKFTYASPKVQQASVVTPRISVPKPTLNLRPLQPVVKIQPPSLPALPKLASQIISTGKNIYQTQIKPIFQPAITGIKQAMATPPPTFNLPQIKQPQLRSAAEAIVNLPGQAWKSIALTPFTGAKGLKETGESILKLAQGKKVTPQEMLAGPAQIGEAALNLYTMGKAPEIKGAISQLGKQGFLPTVIKGAKTTAPYGGAYGLIGGAETGREIPTLPEYGKHLATSTLGGLALGAGLGGITAGGGYALQRGVRLTRSAFENQAAQQFANDIKLNKIELTQHPVIKDYVRAFNLEPLTEKELINSVAKIRSGYIGDQRALYDIHAITNINLPQFKRLTAPELAQVWDYILARKNGATPDIVPPQMQFLDKSITDYAGRIVGQAGFARFGAKIGKEELPPTPAEAIRPAPEKSVDELMGKLRFPTQEGTFDIGGKRIEPRTPPSVGIPLGMKERGVMRTIRTAEVTSSALRKEIEQITGKARFYKSYSDPASLKNAQTIIAMEGIDKAKKIALKGEYNKTNVALSEILLSKAMNEGRWEEAKEILKVMPIKATTAGQANQAWSQWARLTPEGMLKYADKEITTAKEKMGWATKIAQQAFGKKAPELSKESATIITDLMRKANKATTEEEKAKFVKMALQTISDQIPLGVSEVIDAYRFNNMLSGLPTHERNFFNNVWNTFVTPTATLMAEGRPIQAVKYELGALRNIPRGLDAFVKVMRREIPIDLAKVEVGKVRFEKLPRPLTVFSELMEASDKAFSTIIEAAEVGRGVSLEEAKKTATRYLLRRKIGTKGYGFLSDFIDSMAEGIADFGNKFKPVRWAVPFLRTPFDAAKIWLEYSPAGALNIIGNQNKRNVIATTLLGSIATSIGAKLALEGRTSWAAPTDKEQKEWFYATKRKPFSVKLGETWIPAQYFGPFAFAILLPAAAQYYSKEAPEALTSSDLDKLGKTLTSIVSFWSQSSPMSGLGGFVRTMEGDTDFNISRNVAFISSQLKPYVGMLRYITNILDPIYRRPQGFGEQFISDIPILSKKIVDYYKEPTGEPSQREAINYFLPWAIGTEKKEYESQYKTRQQEMQLNKLKNTVKKSYESDKPIPSGADKLMKAELLYKQLKEAQSLLKYGKKDEANQIIDKLKKSELWTPEIKQKVISLEKVEKMGLSQTDRELLRYEGVSRAIKIKEQLDTYKNPTNQTKKLKLLLDTGIIDSETKQELRKLYGSKGIGSKLKSVAPTPALKTGGIKVIPAEITKPTFKPQITEIKPPTPVNVVPMGGTVPSAMELIKKYFPKEQWDNAYKVMMGESGGNPMAIGDNYPIGGEIRPSYGLFQIRTFPDRPPPMQLLTPEANVAYAAKLWRSQGWRPWTAARKLGITR